MEEIKVKNRSKIKEIGYSFLVNPEGLFKQAKMAELKIFLIGYNVFGFSLSAYTLFLSFFNVDVFTRSVLGVLSMAFLAVKIVSAALSTYRKHRLEMFEIKQQLNSAKERELDLRERELSIYDRETQLIKNHKFE